MNAEELTVRDTIVETYIPADKPNNEARYVVEPNQYIIVRDNLERMLEETGQQILSDIKKYVLLWICLFVYDALSN